MTAIKQKVVSKWSELGSVFDATNQLAAKHAHNCKSGTFNALEVGT